MMDYDVMCKSRGHWCDVLNVHDPNWDENDDHKGQLLHSVPHVDKAYNLIMWKSMYPK
jgi:hypothetical protein